MPRSLILRRTLIIFAGWFVACSAMCWAQDEPLPNLFEPLAQPAAVTPSQAPETPADSKPVEKASTENTSTLDDGAKAPQSETPVAVEPNSGVADEASDGDTIKAEPIGEVAENPEVAIDAKKVPAVKDPVIAPPREDLLQGAFTKPYLIEIDQEIDGFFSWYLLKSLEAAQAGGADLVIVKLTTPGGELDLTIELANYLLSIQWAKVVIWIPTRSISGGAILSLGADAIYMKPTAIFGDAGQFF